jgi:hypothetical protein
MTFERDHDHERHRETAARARGERIRDEIAERLRQEGEQDAADLLPHLPNDVSLSEVAFQLIRMSEEGDAEGEVGGAYRLA